MGAVEGAQGFQDDSCLDADKVRRKPDVGVQPVVSMIVILFAVRMCMALIMLVSVIMLVSMVMVMSVIMLMVMVMFVPVIMLFVVGMSMPMSLFVLMPMFMVVVRDHGDFFDISVRMHDPQIWMHG
ncbi:hypothetical protein JCM31598_17050 [Desulfonatronum parangueonense]